VYNFDLIYVYKIINKQVAEIRYIFISFKEHQTNIGIIL